MKSLVFTLLCVAIILITTYLISKAIFNKKIEAEVAQIRRESANTKPSIITIEQLSELPHSVSNWLKNSGIIGKETICVVSLKQRAKMKMKPEQENWNNATAQQFFSINTPAFIWKVKLEMPPFLKIIGRDKFVNGKGEMLIKLFSLLNVANEKGKKIDEGSLQRYLGEIVWFPSAALSPYITWEEIDPLTARATMEYNGTKESGIFHFNKNGEVIQYSALRYKGNETHSKRYEWVINIREHAIMNGIKIPVKMTSTWRLEQGDWTWLDLEITEINYHL